MSNQLIFIGTFLACFVEGVEALTIVLAIGLTRGWRSTWYGVISALFLLSIIVAILGPTLIILPISILRIIVGSLLLIFGLQWIRKAILRSSGYLDIHNEEDKFIKKEQEAQKQEKSSSLQKIDWYSFTVAFKGVLLEGLEVVFIVLTFSANMRSLSISVLGAISAILIVIVAGIKLKRPLSLIPENTLKLIVGIMLTSFGIFWSGEGIGVKWFHQDLSIVGLILTTFVITQIYIRLLQKTLPHESHKIK